MSDEIKTISPGRTIFFFFAFMLLGAGIAFGSDKPASDINCDIQNGACTQTLEGRTIVLEILPRPVEAMKDLTFKVSVDGGYDKEPPYIDLYMSQMNMGKNRVPLKLNGQGVFEGKGVIVRCRSGIRTWRAKITFPGTGVVEYVFDVIY